MKSAIVIPARLESTRLPRKLLLSETGKTLLQHTYEAASCSSLADSVIVAADSAEIVAAVDLFGGHSILTNVNHPSGTDRVAEVAETLEGVDIVVNVQGDEPEISGDAIDVAIRLLAENEAAVMSTLATPIRDRELLESRSCVKVVIDGQGRAMYFSRNPIPCSRDWSESNLAADPPNFFQHVGLYAYRRDFLLEIPRLPKCNIEQIESLEQLRVLHAGHSILVGTVLENRPGIDTPEDYAAFVSRTLNC